MYAEDVIIHYGDGYTFAIGQQILAYDGILEITDQIINQRSYELAAIHKGVKFITGKVVR